MNSRTLPWDWYPGTVPDNVVFEEGTYVETTYSFLRFRSELEDGLVFKSGSHTYKSTMFDVGPSGRVRLGEYALVHGARIICDSEVLIGDYTMISWNVLIMDCYRVPVSPTARRAWLRSFSRGDHEAGESGDDAHPVRIDANVWIGFDVCVLPGVRIGAGSIIGARSVVTDDVPSYTVSAGNPARVIRQLEPERTS